MKLSKKPIVLGVVFLSALIVSNAQAGGECSEATLQGPYGFHTNGVNRGGQQLFASVGIVTFDGVGRAVTDLTTSRDGVISRGSVDAEYVVYPDCTGYIMNMGGGLFQDIVLVDGGNEIRSLASNPDAVPIWTGLYKKQTLSDCTAADMAGNWGYSFQGSILRDESFRPAGIIGLATFDGVGRITGTESRNVGGESVTLPVDTTYTVSSDCTGETAGLSHFVLVGDGSEAFLIRTIDGWVVTGFPKRQ